MHASKHMLPMEQTNAPEHIYAGQIFCSLWEEDYSGIYLLRTTHSRVVPTKHDNQARSLLSQYPDLMNAQQALKLVETYVLILLLGLIVHVVTDMLVGLQENSQIVQVAIFCTI